MKTKLVVMLVVVLSSGCTQTGMRFSIAFTPITAVDERQVLNDKRVELKNAEQRRY